MAQLCEMKKSCKTNTKRNRDLNMTISVHEIESTNNNLSKK